VLGTLLAAALVALAISATANANPLTKDMRMEVWNNTHRFITVGFCPTGHVNINYQSGLTDDPCNQISETQRFQEYGDNLTFPDVNPIGMIVTTYPDHRTWKCYARNPAFGLPFFICDGHKVELVEGEIQTRHINGATIRFHRGGDTHATLNTASVKTMLIEFVGFPAP
jgi:hypothetical protein